MFSNKVDGSGTTKKALLRERGELMSSAVGCGLESASSEPRTGERRHDGIDFLLLRILAFPFRSFYRIANKIEIERLQREKLVVRILRDNTVPADAPYGGTRELLGNSCSLH